MRNQVVPEHPGLPQSLPTAPEKAENASFPISPRLRLLNFLLFIMRSALGNFHCVTANPADKAVRVIYAPTPEAGQFIFQGTGRRHTGKPED